MQRYQYLNDPSESDNKNCLTINITVPPEAEGEAPVMAFIHGGAFVFGSSHFPLYNGRRLVSESVRKGKPVVLTTFNYRLGLLGFLASKDIAEDLKKDGFEGNGNFGLTDQQLALQWVQKYISHFQGDRHNVTIFGESAGAMSVGAHVAARKGHEYFHRAGLLSGSLGSFQSYNEDEHEKFYEKLLKQFDIPLDHPDRLQRLQSIPDQDIVDRSFPMYTTFITLPSLCNDGWLFHNDHEVLRLDAPPSWLKGFMKGETLDEGMIFRDELRCETPAGLEQRLLRRLKPEAVEEIKAAYNFSAKSTFAEKDIFAEQISGDVGFRIPSIIVADACAREKTKVSSYFYHFDQKNYFSDNIYRGDANHALDLVYIFLTKYEAMNAEERTLADAMHTAYVEFAHGNDPWEPYTKNRKWRVWGPDGKVQLLTEEEDEPVRKYKLLRDLWAKDWYQGLFDFVEDLIIKRYRIFD